jgi:hypothetical protein
MDQIESSNTTPNIYEINLTKLFDANIWTQLIQKLNQIQLSCSLTCHITKNKIHQTKITIIIIILLFFTSIYFYTN